MLEPKMHPLIDKEKQAMAKRYRKDNLIVSVSSYITSAIFILILLYFNFSRNYVIFLNDFTASRFFLILLYFAGFYIVYSVITMPFAYFDGYRIEHKYGFSTQRFGAWFLDWLKSFLVTFLLGAVIFEAIFLITLQSENLWWLWLSIIMIIFSVLLANLFPVLILPLFYKTSKLENETLKKGITELFDQAKISIKGIFSINLSSKTTKANAAVVGLGNTKKILLGDTLLNNYAEDEILSALAHEATHDSEQHMWWSILWQSLIIVVMFYIFYQIYPFFYHLAGYEKVSELAAFPLFVFLFTILSFIVKPLESSISRYYERRADRGAIRLTKNPDGLIRLMAKLCNSSLRIAYPNPLIEWYNYSHPSIGKRIQFAEKFKKELI